MMSVLVVMPKPLLRGRARALLHGTPALFAADYGYGLVLAEQNFISDAIIWSPKGLDDRVLRLLLRLREMHRDVRLFVVTPERTPAAELGYTEDVEVEAIAPESRLRNIVQDVLRVPDIVEREESPITATHGSSAGLH
jgi:hypothetical protein